ncbi:MAG: PrsW family glutamic-type intramembrane protease [Cyclobacteriaceae bacterium]|jgi:RsiW-degrading membrane proteinase PrsW (M82 family)|nr:PrsW family glutamic-type intramembrane protease [Flammeovirgaceae bacterium]MCZ8021132.1 PrsW family glutamic-type intramembrane protease [Cytophagales bacterium]MCZ8328616.1 PrsW family glutamic-type intramembrane protease [Cyclobacteriaceae bacterium]
MNFLSLLAIALAPGIAIALYVYLKDKHEREPISLLLMSFLYGALSTLVTLLISWPVHAHFVFEKDNAFDQFINAFFGVALIEEFSKFIFVRFILYRNKNFNEPFDGIVYALMVSMGFATLENILYTFNYGFETGILRMFTAVPAHATFGILMGYFLGKAKFDHKNEGLLAFVALLIATAFHGAYDYFWFISYIPGIWLGAILSLVVGVWLSKKAIRWHQQISPFSKTDNNQEN